MFEELMMKQSEKRLQELIDKAVLTSAPRPLDERVKEAHDRLFQWEKQVKGLSKVEIELITDQSTDEIVIPKRYNFKNDESYLATYAHECIHSTKHKKRLDRKDLSLCSRRISC